MDLHSSRKKARVDVDIPNLPTDPGLRDPISTYNHNVKDEVQRAYLQRGGGNSFVTKDFRTWRKNEVLDEHVGKHSSSHNLARQKCENLMKQSQNIEVILNKQSNSQKSEYRQELNASVDTVRFLQQQGLAFRGHDESVEFTNQGNFLELLRFLGEHNEEINGVILENALENLKLTSPEIQRDKVNTAAVETTNAIINDLGNALFAILVDESRDVSGKEQMEMVLRYINHQGNVIKRFLGITHVKDTTAVTLKKEVESLLSKHRLSMSRIRGQGYDGASNMRGELNGLKTLIMEHNRSAYYIHCFAHQLTLVAVAKNQVQIASFFNLVANVFNVVGASCKRCDILRDKQALEIFKALETSEISSGRGLNQETSLKRAGDTRWSFHFNALINLILMFPSMINVLEIIIEDGSQSDQRGEAYMLLDSINCFDFVFNLYLMKKVLGITNELSQALQRKEQDIVNAMNLVRISKRRLQEMRHDGWDTLIDEVALFCGKNDIEVPSMENLFLPRGRSRRKLPGVTNLHYYHVDIYCAVIDMQLQELNNRFNEVNFELLLCVACLDPSNKFSSFDKGKLLRLAEIYPNDFSMAHIMSLDNQFDTFIIDMLDNEAFSKLNGIGKLAMKMVETRKDTVYSLVFSLLTLALILPVATASVERAFSSMNIVKNRLRNRMGDQWMNDCLITYIEKDVFKSINNEAIMQRFQNMKTHRGHLTNIPTKS